MTTRTMSTRTCLLAVLLAISCGAAARDAKMGSVTVDLAAPRGYCELVDSQASDTRTLQTIRTALGSQNELLAMYADCAQLSDWRKGTRKLLDDYVQYQTTPSLKDVTVEAASTIKDACKSVREMAGQSLTESLVELNKRISTTASSVKVNEVKFLGVVAEDDTACYAAMLQKLTTEIRTEKTQVILMAITVAKGKMLRYIMYTPYVDAETVDKMLARHRINITAFLAANRK